MNKLVPILILSVLLISACIDTSTENRIRPVSSDSFLGRLHLDARIANICVFNTSMVIIFLALVGLTVYYEGEAIAGVPFIKILGMIFMIAAVQLFCQNEIVTFVVMGLLILKPYLFG